MPDNPNDGDSVEPSPLDHVAHQEVVHLISATATAGPAALGELWAELMVTWGPAVASRLWQEGLASSDIGQT